MAKFTTSPNASMLGAIVLAIMESLNYQEYRHLVDPVFAEHGIQEIDPEAYYPAQVLLDMYKMMDGQGNSMFNFVAIGKQVGDNLEFPPEVTTLADAVAGLNDMYRSMLRDFDESELYEFTQVDEQHLVIKDNNPYPHDMVYGYIHSLARRFAPQGARPKVQRSYDNPSDPNAAGATYDVTW